MAKNEVAVWIDSDPSVGSASSKEVDDGFALLQAFRSPELRVEGVSIVFGNAPLAEALPIGRDIVRRCGPPGMAVHAGAAGAEQLGEETDASRALAAALGREKLTVLALGPATNVATVVKNHPDLAARIDAVVAVAGRRPGQQFRAGSAQKAPFRDFNFELDPEAFQVLLDSGVPLVLAPWEVSSKVWLDEDDLARIEAADPGAGWLLEPSREWLGIWRRDLGAGGFNPFDSLAVGWVTSPRLITCEDLGARIEVLPDDIEPGRTKPYLLVRPGPDAGRAVRYCSTPSPEFKQDLMARLTRSREPRRAQP